MDSSFESDSQDNGPVAFIYASFVEIKPMEPHMGAINDYLTRVPEIVPAGKIIVHNRMKWQRTLGLYGFRAWLDDPPPKAHYKLCTCGWAPHLIEHYRSAPSLKWPG